MFSIVLRNAARPGATPFHPTASPAGRSSSNARASCAHHVWYHDWHRVERTLAMFRLEVSNLTAHGWQMVHWTSQTGRNLR